ncbi:MAG: P-loop NTPase [Fimbriimonadaceae bacterium]
MRTIALASGKGGVGKTALALGLATALAEAGRSVLCIDADLGLSNLDILAGIDPDAHLGHVLAGRRRLEEILHVGPLGVRFAFGAPAGGRSGSGLPKKLGDFHLQLAELGPDFDFAVLDTASGNGARSLHSVQAADEAVLVVTPDPASIADAYSTAKMLWRRDFSAKVRVLANQVTSESEAERIVSAIGQVCESYLGTQVDLLGSVRYDPALARSVRERVPLIAKYPNSAAANDLRRVAGELIGEIRGEVVDIRTFLGAPPSRPRAANG